MFALTFGSFGICMLAFWIWAIVEIVNAEFEKENDRLVWLTLVVLVPFIGTILYFAIGRNKRLPKDETV